MLGIAVGLQCSAVYASTEPVPPSTPPLPIKVTIDGHLAFDHGIRFPVVVHSVIPKIQLQLPAGWPLQPDTVRLAFSPRADLVVPPIDASAWQFDARRGQATYQVPFSGPTILYLGDQWVDVNLRGSDNTEAQTRLHFAVGGHNRFFGVFGGEQ